MDAKTRKALEGSIAKWEAIVAGTGADGCADNCPLCELFLDPFSECDDCPVAERAGVGGCMNTPWEAWRKITAYTPRKYRGPGRKVESEIERDLAQAELDFLRSLLPVEAADA